ARGDQPGSLRVLVKLYSEDGGLRSRQAHVDHALFVRVPSPLDAVQIPARKLSLGIGELGALGQRVASGINQPEQSLQGLLSDGLGLSFISIGVEKERADMVGNVRSKVKA